MAKCKCNCCKLEEKLASVLENQTTRDGLPALTKSLAEVIAQHSNGDVQHLRDTFDHTVRKLRDFATEAFMQGEKAKGRSPLDIMAAASGTGGKPSKDNIVKQATEEALKEVMDELPPEVGALLKGLMASAGDVEVHVIKPKQKG